MVSMDLDRHGYKEFIELEERLKTLDLQGIEFLYNRYCGPHTILLATKHFGNYSHEAKRSIAKAYGLAALDGVLTS